MSLAGKRILVTRPPDEGDELIELLRARGAEPIAAPAIEIAPVEGEALARLDAAARDVAGGEFAWVVFTSARAVDAVLGRLAAQGYGPFPQVVRARLAAIGPATGDRLNEAGLHADLVPDPFTTDGLASAFPSGEGRVLTPRADIAPEGLEEALAAKGWAPSRVDAYRTVFPGRLPDDAIRAISDDAIDAVAFTSGSTVRGFFRAADGLPTRIRVCCIGPVTAREAEAAGLHVDAVAEPHTIEGLVEALDRLFEEQMKT
jgi:uroporphyrinogen-III synthase